MRDPEVEEVRRELLALRGEVRDGLGQYQRGFEELREGQRAIKQTVDEMNGRVARVNAEIGFGLPEPEERQGRDTIRNRIHALENEDHVAKAIHDSYARTFGRWQKIGLFVFASAAAVEGLLRLVGVGG